MRAAQLTAFGRASEVLRVADFPKPEPGHGELLLEMLAAVINPADLNVIDGKYGELPELPAIIGNEGVGRVASLGPGVTGFAVGDLVLPMRSGAWCEYLIAEADEVIRLPSLLDPFQAAMLMINPTTAWEMLGQFVDLHHDDWIVQNAANSAVGRCVIQLAKLRGIKTLNVVRRAEVIDELKALGADAVVTEDCDLREEVTRLCGGSRPILALNAVGGASALNLANALEDGGTLVTYGAMGRQPLKIPNGLLIFRRLTFTGFWLREWKRTAQPTEKQTTLFHLAELVIEGKLVQPIHRVYSLTELADAVAEAAREARSGKVLLDLRS